MMTKINKTLIGSRVTLGPNVLHEQFAGMVGVIHKAVASRNVYTVRLDDGRTYDANPDNVLAAA